MKKTILILFALTFPQPANAMDRPEKSIPWELLNGTKHSNEKPPKASTEKPSLNEQLIKSVSNNYTEQVEIFLAHGADANATDKHYVPALILAIENENEAICRTLIAAGASLEMDCNCNLDQYPCWSPLTTAVRTGNKPICKLLIKSGAEINEFENIAGPNDTALWHAVYHGHIEIVKLLMRHGARKPRSNVIKLPLLPSIEMHKNFKEMHELLEQHSIALEMRTPSEQNRVEDCLLLHIMKYHFGATKKLLQLGIDVNCAPDREQGDTPLHYAACHPYFAVKKILKLLLKLGANPNAQNRYLGTPLMCACTLFNRDGGDEKNCNLLLASGALTDLTNNKGETALHYAARNYSEKICQLLLNNDASIDAQDDKGNTPFIISIEYYHNNYYLSRTKIFLDAQPNMLIKENNGNTALIVAAWNQSCLCPLFLEHQKNQEKKVITLLLCLKHHEQADMRELYRWNDQLFRPYLERYTIKALLNARNDDGKCAYDYYQVDYLKPNTGKERTL